MNEYTKSEVKLLSHFIPTFDTIKDGFKVQPIQLYHMAAVNAFMHTNKYEMKYVLTLQTVLRMLTLDPKCRGTTEFDRTITDKIGVK